MFCRQHRGYLMSHTGLRLLGSCSVMASALKGHGGKMQCPSRANNMAHTRETGSALPVDMQNVTVSCFACSHTSTSWPQREACAAFVGTASCGRRDLDFSGQTADLLTGLVPSLRCNYPDCRSTMGDTGRHKGLTMEKANRDAHLCSTIDSKPWSLVLFVMISHTWENKTNWSWDTSYYPHLLICWFCSCANNFY